MGKGLSVVGQYSLGTTIVDIESERGLESERMYLLDRHIILNDELNESHPQRLIHLAVLLF
jgi:hypothetical protein